jgi:hypothetical protein
MEFKINQHQIGIKGFVMGFLFGPFSISFVFFCKKNGSRRPGINNRYSKENRFLYKDKQP